MNDPVAAHRTFEQDVAPGPVSRRHVLRLRLPRGSDRYEVVAPELGRRFDLVFVDQRGVGSSSPIACVDDAFLDERRQQLPLEPSTDADWTAVADYWTRFGTRCAMEGFDLVATRFTPTERQEAHARWLPRDAPGSALGSPVVLTDSLSFWAYVFRIRSSGVGAPC